MRTCCAQLLTTLWKANNEMQRKLNRLQTAVDARSEQTEV
jgi:hypothetical protein